MLSDDDLAKIAHQARQKGRFAPTWDDNWRHAWPQVMPSDIARAVRVSILPDVAPLRPGETVTRGCMMAQGDWPVMTPSEIVKAAEAEVRERRRIAEMEARIAALAAQRDRLWRYVLAHEAYEATVGDFPDDDLPALSDRLTERAAARRAARQACLEAGDLEDDHE